MIQDKLTEMYNRKKPLEELVYTLLTLYKAKINSPIKGKIKLYSDFLNSRSLPLILNTVTEINQEKLQQVSSSFIADEKKIAPGECELVKLKNSKGEYIKIGLHTLEELQKFCNNPIYEKVDHHRMEINFLVDLPNQQVIPDEIMICEREIIKDKTINNHKEVKTNSESSPSRTSTRNFLNHSTGSILKDEEEFDPNLF